MSLARALAETLGLRGRAVAPRVLVTRSAEQSGELMLALAAHGLDPVSVPAIEVVIVGLDGARGTRPDWIVVTSSNGARAVLQDAGDHSPTLRAARWAAIGRATAALLERSGVDVVFRPSRSAGASLASELPIGPGDRVLVVRGDLADDELVASLRARGASVDDVVAYRTLGAPASSRALLRRAAAGPIAAIVFTSGSTVRGLVALARTEALNLASIPAVCIGPETAVAARAAGFEVAAVSAEPGAKALASAVARALLRQPMDVR